MTSDEAQQAQYVV
jgi:hypothetical protein